MGRTGSGKSFGTFNANKSTVRWPLHKRDSLRSLLLAILQLVPYSGSIEAGLQMFTVSVLFVREGVQYTA